MPTMLMTDEYMRPDDLALVTECLEQRLGVSCWPAGDFDGALAVLTQRRPDIVLADAHLVPGAPPPLYGLELLRKARELMPTTKVVVVACYEGFRSTALALGADAFLVKPVGAQELLDVLQRLMGDRIAGER